jgi:hypothetical protein
MYLLGAELRLLREQLNVDTSVAEEVSLWDVLDPIADLMQGRVASIAEHDAIALHTRTIETTHTNGIFMLLTLRIIIYLVLVLHHGSTLHSD